MSMTVHQYQALFNKVVDKLFAELVGSENPDLDYFQSRISRIVEKFEHDVGPSVYKLYICQAVIHFYDSCYTEAIAAIERSDEARDGKEIHREYERAKNHIIAESHVVIGKLQAVLDERAETQEIGKSAWKAIGYSIGCFVLGGIITGISYSSTEPGDTYTVMTGLFVVGGVYGCVALYRIFRWVSRKLVD